MTNHDDRWINEDKHKQGKPHLKKLFGMVLCRLCYDVSSFNGKTSDSESGNESSTLSETAKPKDK